MRLGDDILVLNRHHRHVDPDHLAGLPREIAGGRDNVLANDVAFVGRNLPFAAWLPLDRDHGRLAVDLSPEFARRPRKRLRKIRRLDIAVLGMLDRADDSVDVAERPDLLDLLRGQELDLDADRGGDSGVIVIFVHPVAGAREADVGDLAQADVEAGLFLERPIEADRIFVDLPDRIAEIEERQEARRVPGRARRQLLALDENAVAPAFPG